MMTTEKRQRRDFTEEFKRDAVALVLEQNYTIAEAARSLEITAGLLGRWKREHSAQSTGTIFGQDEREELLRLRKEVRMLRMEKDILKKASQFFAKEMK
jgi:transposase